MAKRQKICSKEVATLRNEIHYLRQINHEVDISVHAREYDLKVAYDKIAVLERTAQEKTEFHQQELKHQQRELRSKAEELERVRASNRHLEENMQAVQNQMASAAKALITSSSHVFAHDDLVGNET